MSTIKLFLILLKEENRIVPLSSVFQRVPVKIYGHLFDAACSPIVVERESCRSALH